MLKSPEAKWKST